MSYQIAIKRSRRARRLRVTVHPGGSVVLVAPQQYPLFALERFLSERGAWIGKAVRKMRGLQRVPGGVRDYLLHKEVARRLVHERLAHWNARYGYTYHRVAIKNTRSLWGSCSRRGNLNFSYKLLFLPPKLADYVIIHELCHLKEHNHSPKFWALVAETCPDYRMLRAQLRTYLLK